MKKKNEEEDIKVEAYNIGDELDKSKEYREMYDKAYTFNQDRFDAYAELMAFFQGNQHLLKRYKTERPWVVNMNTPYATASIENRVASLLVSDYEGDLMPLAPEDIEVVEALDSAYKREWERMQIDEIIRRSVELSAVVREAYCHIYVDDKKIHGGRYSKRVGALCAEIIDPSSILIDPSGRDFKKARYIIVQGRISKKEALETYPKLKALSLQADSFTPTQRGEIYYDNDYSTSQEDVFTVWNIYVKENGKIKKVKLINAIIVKESELDIDCVPIAQLRWKKAAQSCYGISLMDQLLSLQKAVCAIESAITNTAIAYAAPSMMVSKGSGVDPKMVAKANGAPGVVYSVNGNLDNAMRPVVPPKIQDEILSIKQDFEAKIKEISGNTNQFLGNIGTAANTAGGAQVAVERAKIIETNIINNLEEYVEDIVNIIIKFMMKLYPGSELTYNRGKNGEGIYEFDRIKMPSKKELKDLEYTFYVELNKKSQYSKEQQRQNLMDLFQFERQYDTAVKTVTVADIIKNSDIENKDEIISRYNDLTKQDAETKAETIEKIVNIGTQMGVPQELITQSVTEIIAGNDETPATDQVMQMIEQGFQQQMQQAEQARQTQSIDQGGDINASPEAVDMAKQMLSSGQV
jgi:hypothetical protein